MAEDINKIRQRSITRTQEFWSKRLGREVSQEEAREMIVNVTGFFKVLAKRINEPRENRMNPHQIFQSVNRLLERRGCAETQVRRFSKLEN